MGLLNGLMMGIGDAANTYGNNRTKDIRDAVIAKAELDKENRVREAKQTDAALARQQKLDDYATARTDNAADHIASLEADAKFKDSRFETDLEHLKQTNDVTKAVDHYDPEEQSLKIEGMRKTLDSLNVPESVKSDNLAYKQELDSIKANRMAMNAAGTLDEA